MRLLSWARRVVADRGELEPVVIDLERAPDGEGYLFRLGVRAGFGGQDAARIPVNRRVNPDPHPVLKEIHFCEVAGRTLEAANPYALRGKVAALLETIAPARALPLCYFRVPAMDYELPVYEEGGDITSPVIGGPKLKAPDLAAIRVRVCRYLLSAGYVHDADEVAVGVLRPRDLRLVEPAAVFRSHADRELWLPAVEGVSPEGPVVGIVGHSPRLQRAERLRHGDGAGPAMVDSAPAAPDVVALLRFIRAELERTGGVSDPESVYASQVRPEIWTAAEARSEDSGRFLVAPLSDDEATSLELTIRRTGAGDVTTALEDRGVNVFLSPDEEALAACVGRYLAAHGFLRFAQEIEVRSVAAPRAERLETETIWTHGGRGNDRGRADDPEGGEPAPAKEVHEVWS